MKNTDKLIYVFILCTTNLILIVCLFTVKLYFHRVRLFAMPSSSSTDVYIGKYKVGKAIGSGNFSKVRIGTDPQGRD